MILILIFCFVRGRFHRPTLPWQPLRWRLILYYINGDAVIKGCSHVAVATVIYFSQLMGSMRFSVIVRMAPCEHLHWILHKPSVTIRNRSRNSASSPLVSKLSRLRSHSREALPSGNEPLNLSHTARLRIQFVYHIKWVVGLSANVHMVRLRQWHDNWHCS